MDSGHFELFLNCLTIYFILWLRDILVVCRSGYRSGLLNCVGILYNFGMVGMVRVWCFGSEDSRCWILELACEWNAYPGFGGRYIKSKCKIPPLLRDKTARGIKLHIVQKCKLQIIDNLHGYRVYIDKKHRLRLDFLIWIIGDDIIVQYYHLSGSACINNFYR